MRAEEDLSISQLLDPLIRMLKRMGRLSLTAVPFFCLKMYLKGIDKILFTYMFNLTVIFHYFVDFIPTLPEW